MSWVNEKVLEDIDFAADLCLLAASRVKLWLVLDWSKTDCINCTKTKEMRVITSNIAPIYVNNEAVKPEQKFIYLESVVDSLGGAEADIEAQINKFQFAYVQLKPV